MDNREAMIAEHSAAVLNGDHCQKPLGTEASGCQRMDYLSIDRGADVLTSAHEPVTASPPGVPVSPPKCYRQKGTVLEHLVYFCALATTSYIGVIVRIYLTKLSEWNGVTFFPSIAPEIVGTALMGFIGSHKNLLQVKHKAIYQGIATGLCGSITTFSSWNYEATVVLLQIDQDPVNYVTGGVKWGTTIILGLGMPFAALTFGQHAACLSPWNDQRLPLKIDDQPTRKCVTTEGITFIILWCLSIGIGITVTYHFSSFDLLFSIVFSALGTYIRWHLSPLNALFKSFKIGTFIVNVAGTWILGATVVTRRYLRASSEGDEIAFNVLVGMGTGFCGCLTTVSTLAVELSSLPIRGTYIYAICSIVLAHAGLVIIVGVYEWAV